MKIKSLIIAFVLITTNYANAQSYSTALGVKGLRSYYSDIGFNVKHDFGGIYGDFTIGGNKNYFTLNAIAEKQNELSEGFEWYYGVGGYVNSWRDGYYIYDNHKDVYYLNDRWGIGALAVIGIEYTFNKLPINIGIDFGPTMNLIPYYNFYFGGSGFIRYAIK
jgi:hypothetical protein